jgi:excisionase family DNA binding protein
VTWLYNFSNPPAVGRYRQKRAMWEASLTQDTYTVPEAAKVMNMGERRVRRLLKSGDLYYENPGQRSTVIPKEAIIRCMVGPSPMEKIIERKTE